MMFLRNEVASWVHFNLTIWVRLRPHVLSLVQKEIPPFCVINLQWMSLFWCAFELLLLCSL